MNRHDPIDELARPPLALVIGQVRFSPVRKMPEMVDDLQETMRHVGLERFDEEKVQQVHFGPKITTSDVTRWVFRNRNRTESVFLTQDFIVLATSEYARFEAFQDRLVSLVGKLQEIANPSFAEQVGIRYLNLLREIDGVTPNQLVADGLRGLSGDELECKTSQTQTMTRSQTDIGVLTIRCLDMVGSDFLPPDLQIQGMKFSNTPNEQESYRLLDIDNTTSSGDGIEFDDLKELLWNLHRFTSRAFKQSVTDFARECWRKQQ
ncbi:TIGR04255 family protein [Aporhodopirellula aestuarii]|uniref:TIGR04255 family protein n=1 Tax=Aporhodopirellula aestuarii TaxID=2950107 RepID=A0ABT0U2K4_9BACT|nr:TIGR04255 family protein [Aporhodopirellula aestuarii]MCM2370826.1 TIGR04255 family protein [Aporhodopirellula aestuarii]